MLSRYWCVLLAAHVFVVPVTRRIPSAHWVDDIYMLAALPREIANEACALRLQRCKHIS